MLPDELPDNIYIEFIRRALFRPLSRASVMVGAGFSRNADKISSAVPDFPLWWDIASRLYGDLYPGKPLGFGVDVPRLGHEYAETYSRAELDDLIAGIIPDGKYESGEMHRLLLELPWADVFTTNYDTLLERARSKVYEIKYDVVLTPPDIANAERPRIVKLHGSFPSQRPFVFTSEDYRRYPVEQAPFVNIVQQSIMESAFCLIGFSGDDPNFLHWAGWVHDQLGPAAPRIYLCGVLDLNASRRRYYESLRVIPVDLGPLFPESRFGGERHATAMRWFLRSLHNGKPVDRSEWPKVRSMPSARPSQPEETPPLAGSSMPMILNAPRRVGKDIDVETLQKLVQSWRSEREAYPGWVICPEPNRQGLWVGNLGWIHYGPRDPLPKALTALTPAELPGALYEIVWRLRRGRWPLTRALVEQISALFEADVLPPTFTGRHQPMARPPEGWDTLTERLVELGFAMVNEAWQEQNEEQHRLWMERLRKVVALKPEWRARWHFAECWHHLLRLDEEAVLIAWKEWPENPGLPFWEAKRAMVLAELGDVEVATRIAEVALERARQAIDPTRPDYRALSEEGCLVELLRVLDRERERSRLESDRDITFVTRLRELRRDRCDPAEILTESVRELQQPSPGVSHAKTPGFDPGTNVSSTNFRASNLIEWVLCQVLHDGLWPVPHVSVAAESIVESVRRIWLSSRRLAIAIAIRAGKVDKFETMLSRVEVARMDAANADALYDWLARALRSAMKASPAPATISTDASGWRNRLIDGCPRILSRLCARISPDRLQDAFDLAVAMYEANLFRQNFAYHWHVQNMFKRVVSVATMAQKLAWLPRLLKLPIPDLEGFVVGRAEWWPEPMQYLLESPRPFVAAPAQDADAVNRLVRAVQDGSRTARERASHRLTGLAWAKTLTAGQMKAYVGALWSKTDGAGFPIHPGFAPWFLLELDERKPGEAREAITRFFLKSDISTTPNYFQWLGQSAIERADVEREQTTKIEWSSAEAELLLGKIVNWRRDKRDPVSHAGDVTIHMPQEAQWSKRKRRESWLVAVIANVLIRSLAKGGSDASRIAVRKLLSEIEQAGISIRLALPALLLLDSSGKEDAARQIRAALHGGTEDDVLDGCEALVSWLTLVNTEQVAPPPSYLLNELVGNIVSRRQPGLRFALRILYLILRRLPEVIESYHADGLSRALGFLLHETDAAQHQDEGDGLPMTSEERVHIRGDASQLAAYLARYYHTRGQPLPPEVEAWRSSGAADPLPEVRLAWAEVPPEGGSVAAMPPSSEDNAKNEAPHD